MLQQTQVATVIPFFERFLHRFPTLEELAQADEQEVLRFWQGLGYYRRARALSRSARILKELKHTTIPNDPELLAELPGFGRYTVGAVLSQAYNRRMPILEVNSQRVLCRLFCVEDAPTSAVVRKRLWELAESILPTSSVGDFNQALMELGALVCTPTLPNCPVCPLQKQCAARKRNRQAQIPVPSKPEQVTDVKEVAVVLRRRDKFLLVQRPAEGRWANMWEFPHHPVNAGESLDSAAMRLLSAMDLTGKMDQELLKIRHRVTRFRIDMTCLLFVHRHGRPRAGEYSSIEWVLASELQNFPLSTPQRRLARRILGLGSRQFRRTR